MITILQGFQHLAVKTHFKLRISLVSPNYPQNNVKLVIFYKVWFKSVSVSTWVLLMDGLGIAKTVTVTGVLL